MAIVDEHREAGQDLLELDGPGLEEMQGAADNESNGGMETVNITIEWLEARIVEFETMYAVVRSFRTQNEELQAPV